MFDRRMFRFFSAAMVFAALLTFAPAVQAQAPILKAQATPDTAKPEAKGDFCPGFIAGNRPRAIPAALASDQVRITFVGHATFLIESPKLVRIATDYNDYVRPPIVPDIATMNHAHTTHYTERPDPAIKHLLRGWRDDGKPAAWDVSYQDVRVRSIATNTRDWNGGTQRHGNSIFVFEIGSLCIAHLGHLHHTLTQAQLDEIGRVDVVMVPVDGSWTMDLEGMAEVLQSLKAQLMIPMHYFSMSTLNRFLERVRDKYEVEQRDTPSIVVSRASMPPKPKFLVLPGR